MLPPGTLAPSGGVSGLSSVDVMVVTLVNCFRGLRKVTTEVAGGRSTRTHRVATNPDKIEHATQIQVALVVLQLITDTYKHRGFHAIGC